MHQISTFYNHIASAYIVNRSVSSDDTTTLRSNQLGREAATSDTDPDNTMTKGDLLDGDLLYQDHSMASVAIDYVLNFTFYTRNQVMITPSVNVVKTLDFEEAFEHHLIELTIFDKAYNYKDPKQ